MAKNKSNKRSYINSLLKIKGIHSQRFHQQIEVAAFIGEDFMRIIRKHGAKVKSITGLKDVI